MLVARPRSLQEAVKIAERFALVGQQPSRSRARDMNRVATVEKSDPLTEVKDLLVAMKGQLNEQGNRLSALEKSKSERRPAASSGSKRCYLCQDPSHFLKDCPIRLALLKDGKLKSGKGSGN